ncbi:MAG: hypothetical protein KJ950_13135 [Proteobacteria bacterium]|nr:hypothetical protein [Pseudomonadota bacterium]MBU1688422.1 hypothetical protein [Pseudomonadota bacterium]
MENLVKELSKLMRFKETCEVGDLVLIVMAQPQPAFIYALVSSIERDFTRKDEWWHLTIQMLTVPPRETVWTLRLDQFTGQEIFTMGGEKRFVKAVDLTPSPKMVDEGNPKKKSGQTRLKVVK